MIPPLDHRGLLPPGVHVAQNWDELAAAFAGNAHRRDLLADLKVWVSQELQFHGAGLELVIGGSFVTSKPMPADIDCTVRIPVDEIRERGALLQLLIQDGAKGRIHQEFRVEIYPTLVSPGASDFSVFFQYVGEKSALIHRCDAKDVRGVIKVESWLPG